MTQSNIDDQVEMGWLNTAGLMRQSGDKPAGGWGRSGHWDTRESGYCRVGGRGCSQSQWDDWDGWRSQRASGEQVEKGNEVKMQLKRGREAERDQNVGHMLAD